MANTLLPFRQPEKACVRTRPYGRQGKSRNVYLPREMVDELKHEGQRLDRSLTWLLIRAWMIARERIKKQPGALYPRQVLSRGETLHPAAGPGVSTRRPS